MSRRVQKLLNCGNYPGLSSDVVLEAPCFKLRENGEVERHVYLAVTKTDFVMAAQALPNYTMFPNVKYRANVDLELEGLELVSSSPLDYVRFFIIDSRSRKFAVCTSLGNVWYFEMCNTADGSDDQWTKWRERMAEQDNPLIYGYKLWTVTKEDALDARKRAFPIEIEGEMGSLKFIKRPVSFCAVESVGVQYSLTSLQAEKPDTAYVRPTQTQTQNHNGNHQANGGDIRSTNFHNTDAHFLPPAVSTIHVHSRSSASQSLTDLNIHEKADILCEEGVGAKRSQSDCVITMSSTAFSPSTSFHYKFSIISFICEALPEEPHMAVDIVAIRFNKWGLGRTTVNQLYKIWTLRHEERLKRQRESLLNQSDSDESITDIFEEFSEAKRKKQVLKRWQSALPAKTKPSTLDDLIKSIGFDTCGINKHKEKLWLYGATPAEIAAQVTQIHIDMFKKVTELDIITFFDKHHHVCASSLVELLSLSRGVSLLVTREILQSKTLAQQTQRVKYFIQVCKSCRESRDLQSTWAVLTGIRLLPVAKLKASLLFIDKEFPASMREYRNISRLFSNMSSPRYTEELESSSQCRPYLVWLNHLLWHMQHALHRTFDDARSTEAKKTRNVHKKHQLGLGRKKLSGKKTSSLTVSGTLTQAISQHRQGSLTGGSWMTFYKQSDSTSGQEVRGQGAHGHLESSSASPVLVDLADTLSSQIIREALKEHCKRPTRTGQTRGGRTTTIDAKSTKYVKTSRRIAKSDRMKQDDRSKGKVAKDTRSAKTVCVAKETTSAKTVCVAKVTRSAKTVCVAKDTRSAKTVCVAKVTTSAKHVRVVKDVPVIHVSTTEKKDSGKQAEAKNNRMTDMHSRHIQGEEAEKKNLTDQTGKPSTSGLANILVPKSDIHKQLGLKTKSGSTWKSIASKHIESRRKSLFQLVSENEELFKQKERAIDEAIQAQLSKKKSGSLLQSWSEEGEDNDKEQKGAVDGSVQRKTTFFGSLFTSNKASNNHASPTRGSTSDMSSSKTLYGHETNISSIRPPNRKDENNGGTSRALKLGLLKEKSDSLPGLKKKSVRFQSNPIQQQRDDLTDNSRTKDENTNWSSSANCGEDKHKSSSAHHRMQNRKTRSADYGQDIRWRHSRSHTSLLHQDNLKRKTCLEWGGRLEDRDLIGENRNWSSSTHKSPSITGCPVCHRRGCILSRSGLEKLVELQIACLTYHLKSNSKLYAYIREESRRITLNQILGTTGSKHH